jgi:putative Mg2+ transporter-C (MgtC) family protein
VIQGVIAGIGFLGAGTIIKHRQDEEVIGLTTAASIWTTSAIGVACGLGRDSTAIILALLCWVVLNLVEVLSRFIKRRQP